MMKREIFHSRGVLFKNTPLQILIVLSVVALISNINAIVDSVLHPDIPYLDEEHLIVGGITGLVSAILFGMAIVYARHLEQALTRIRTLESFLPICANCKKIRVSDSNETQKESWTSIESYISERTDTKFSHGICPDCVKELYPEYGKEKEIRDKVAPNQ